MSDDLIPQAEQPRCADRDCQASLSCPLYLPAHSPARRLIRVTLRQNWESERIPCMARLRFESSEPAAKPCPVCHGNDGEAPCAYPSEGKAGCPREHRLGDGLK